MTAIVYTDATQFKGTHSKDSRFFGKPVFHSFLSHSVCLSLPFRRGWDVLIAMVEAAASLFNSYAAILGAQNCPPACLPPWLSHSGVLEGPVAFLKSCIHLLQFVLQTPNLPSFDAPPACLAIAELLESTAHVGVFVGR